MMNKNELDELLRVTYHKNYTPTDYLNQSILHNIKECEDMRQSENKDKKMKVEYDRGIKKFTKAAAIIVLLGCVGFMGACAAKGTKPISVIIQSIFHNDDKDKDMVNSMGKATENLQIQDGVKITQTAVLADGEAYAFFFDIEKEDGTAFDFPENIFKETDTSGISLGFGSTKEHTALDESREYSMTSHFYDDNPADACIQLVTIYESNCIEKDDSLIQTFTNLELYDEKKDTSSIIAEGTWEFTSSLNCEDMPKVGFENQNATLGLLSATKGTCVVSPLKYSMEFSISLEEYKKNYGYEPLDDTVNRMYKDKTEIYAEDVDKVADCSDIDNLSKDIKKQGIYLNMTDGEKRDITKLIMIDMMIDDEYGKEGILTIHKVFDEIVPVENIESISIGDQTFEIEKK